MGEFNIRDEVLNKVVYQPIGLLSAVLKALPNAAEEGKRAVAGPVQTAQFVGQMASGVVKARYGESIRNLEDKVDDARKGVEDVLEEMRRTAERRMGDVFGARSETVVDADVVAETPAGVGGVANYEKLTAAEVIDLLASLSDENLRAVEEFEMTHRKRRTVLAQISRVRERRS